MDTTKDDEPNVVIGGDDPQTEFQRRLLACWQGIDTLVLGLAAYDAAMQEKVFDPLGMRDTTFSMARALATVDHASPHGKDADGKLQLASLDIAYAGLRQ